MFLRKLVVVVLPLLMVALVCFLLPLMEGMPFWTEVFKGVTLGVTLALVLPLCGATKKREPFSGLLWAPLTMLILVVLSQYLAVIGISVPVLDAFKTGDGNVILVECTFIGFLAVQMLRTRK
ncbi:MAG: hypothetical protein ACI4WX_07945 [Aristaeellaceae bacterium]